jgi:hypothetical protein
MLPKPLRRSYYKKDFSLSTSPIFTTTKKGTRIFSVTIMATCRSVTIGIYWFGERKKTDWYCLINSANNSDSFLYAVPATAIISAMLSGFK